MANNIVTATVTIKGTRPLFQNRFGPDSMPLEKQERTGVAGNDPIEWRRTAMVTRDGQLYVEPTYIFATIREGGKYTKQGRGSLMSSISATLQVIDDRILIDRWLPGYPNGHACDITTTPEPSHDPDESVYIDIRGVRNPATKARNVRYRLVASTGWSCLFRIMWDKTIISRAQMEAAIIDAGRLVGLANARAIGMGRFELVSFDVSE